MTEADLVNFIFAIYDRYWSMAQWWVSITFGLIIVAHFAASKLNLYLVILLILLYTAFTGWLGMFYIYNMDIVGGYLTDLRSMENISNRGTLALMRSEAIPLGALFQNISVMVMYFGSVSYLIYAYTKEVST